MILRGLRELASHAAVNFLTNMVLFNPVNAIGQ